MNGMVHNIPNLLGLQDGGIEDKIRKLIPQYMLMGEKGMETMYVMHDMDLPPNFLPFGSPGPFGSIEMGGMFTVLKVRDDIKGYQDPGWYQHPAGSVAGSYVNR